MMFYVCNEVGEVRTKPSHLVKVSKILINANCKFCHKYSKHIHWKAFKYPVIKCEKTELS